jgi:hypothetical protein
VTLMALTFVNRLLLLQPAVAVCPNPVLFELPENSSKDSDNDNEEALLNNTTSNDDNSQDPMHTDATKENTSPQKEVDQQQQQQRSNQQSLNGSSNNNRAAPRSRSQPKTLPYRSIFCVLTCDSVLIYDTHHTQPLSVVQGLHYSNLTDATWSADGHNLMVCSTDGYVSIIRFTPGELGKVYHPQQPCVTRGVVNNQKAVGDSSFAPNRAPQRSLLPPCDPGPTNILIGRPSKRAKTRVTPTLVEPPCTTTTVSSTLTPAKRSASKVIVQDIISVDKLSLNHNNSSSTTTNNATATLEEHAQQHHHHPETLASLPNKKKQKKRIQPTVVVMSTSS